MNELPRGWTRSTIGGVARVEMGQSPSGSATNSGGIGVPLIGGAADYQGNHIVANRFTTKSTKVCEAGDLILCIRATIGKVAVADRRYCLGRGVAGIRALSIDPEFLCRFITSQATALDEAGTGTTFRQIDKKALNSWPISVPPVNEQRRIVAKLDSLFKHTKSAREELSRIPRLIERQRSAILAAAVRGDLTKQWRANNPKIKLASTTLPNQKEAPEGPDLPKSWTCCRVGEAGEVTLGRQRSPQHHSGNHMRPYLRVANVFEDRLALSDVMQMNFTPEEYERFKLEPGDILLNEGQSKELVGRPAMFNGQLDGVCFTNTLVRFRAYSTISANYALLVFRHYLRSGLFRTIANITTNIAHLGAGRFASLPFPLPPTAEQEEIVRLCHAKFAVLDNTESDTASSLALLSRLEQAALTKAFQGQLQV